MYVQKVIVTALKVKTISLEASSLSRCSEHTQVQELKRTYNKMPKFPQILLVPTVLEIDGGL